MAGTEPVGVGEAEDEDDALYVLTAVLLTPAQFPSLLGDDYPEACAALGLEPYAEGYGLVLGQDGAGARWTVVVDDVSLVAVAIASWDCGMEYDLSPDERSVVVALPGWPIALAVAAPHVPAPHDPETAPGEREPLTPPDPRQWGPAQRRLGADAVAVQWTAWREQLGDDDFGRPESGGSTAEEAPGDQARGDGARVTQVAGRQAHESGATVDRAGGGGARGAQMPGDQARGGGAAPVGGAPEAGAPGKGTTGEGVPGEGTPQNGAAVDRTPENGAPGDGATGEGDEHDPLRRVLAELRRYLEEPPPPGRVRSGFAPGGARTLRADGPGWSLVARTDDMAFVLLDEMPREVLPIGRGPNLPALLAALDAMAVRPA
ncbi:hypothetical protein ACGF5F_28485 [Streptomyces sp. NPDC047821]|uniref:hypothetical protein n=1 Tax=Streptomyces sp. NPDC047821 TaxID=3365488 RepID=UPI003722A3F5